MKIQLPNGREKELDESLSESEKMDVVVRLVTEWDDIINDNRSSFSVIIFLDSLANYLVWHKEKKDKGREDKFVLSRKKMEMLVRYKKTSKTTNFSDLNNSQSEVLFGERGLV